MGDQLSKLKPTLLWQHFAEILKIPHGSGNEKAFGDYIIGIAKKNKLEWDRDNAGNVVVRKKASKGREQATGVILQGHLDMVCEKNSDVQHDFKKDPIKASVKGEWVQASGTTLGADNGIGAAAALAIMEDDSLVIPPMEFLFTVDEETGLTGARKIGTDFLKGRIMLNLDSEEEGEFTIGCAGGADSEMTLPLKRKENAKGDLYRLRLYGFRGGHSGIDIDKGRGNAIKLLARMLWQASQHFTFDIVDVEGGNLRNAIPRESHADILVNPKQAEPLSGFFDEAFGRIASEYKAVETDAAFAFEKLKGKKKKPLSGSSKKALINLLFTLPHGVLSMHPEMKGLVETSTNLAVVHTYPTRSTVISSTRSSIGSALEAGRDQIAAVCDSTGAKILQPEGYPGWTPNLQSPILKTMKALYKKNFKKTPHVAAIHAGLECGIIGEKFEGMDMISFGPTIEHPHSPDERAHIGSVETFWKFLTNVLAELV